MKRSDVQAWLDGHNIDCRTISLCVAIDDNGDTLHGDDDRGSDDPWFGDCEISGDKGNVYRCTAVTKDGENVEFDAGDWLITAALGRIAGAL